MMDQLLKRLTQKKEQLDRLKPLPESVVKQLDDWLRVELTYSSNAIEGNTLTRLETAEVLEKGIGAVISGKPLKDQLEAINHAQALDLVKKLAGQKKSHQLIGEKEIKSIHRLILAGIDDQWAGKYRQTQVFVKGTDVEFPLPHRVPYLMAEFIQWLEGQQKIHPARVAAQAHFRLVSIHPFVDGNGRTARLLMNLILLINDYPPAVIRNEERVKYLEAINQGQKENNLVAFHQLIEEGVECSLDAYLKVAQGKSALVFLGKGVKGSTGVDPGLLKIGQLAQKAGEAVSSIRYWTQEGLLQVIGQTQGGYQLYHPSMIEKIKRIKQLQRERRLSIAEIKQELKRANQ